MDKANILKEFKNHLLSIKSDEVRQEAINEVLEDFCKECGSIVVNRSCYCWNDE